MTYSIIGILAAVILLIINRDVLWGRYVISYLERKNLFSSILLLFRKHLPRTGDTDGHREYLQTGDLQFR